MLPSIDLRIATLVKAVQQVILPALPADERLAQEQCRLIVGHLGLISQQWKHALRYELISLDNMRNLARGLCGVVQPEQAAILEQALAAVADLNRDDLDATQAAILIVGKAIDVVIEGDDGRIPLADAAGQLILAYGRNQSRRERTWFKGHGQDPDAAELPEITAIV